MMLAHFVRSVRYAGRGLRYTYVHEANFRLQCLAAVLVCVLSAVLPLRSWEVVALIMMVALVLILELVNTAIEVCADLLVPRLHHHVGIIKDVMAGAVLLASCTALAIAMVVIFPHVLPYLVVWLK